MRAFLKDPAERLDYDLNLATEFAGLGDGDTIASSNVVAASGITLDSQGHTADRVVAWLADGTHGSDYEIRFQATTVAGRVYERSAVVKVREQ